MLNNKKTRKRQTSNKDYVDALQSNHSKLCVIRVDLSYKNPHSEEITLEDANKDLKKLLNNRRSKPTIFEHNVGYTIKKEYTEDKGVHLHSVFYFDGQKVQKDAHKADELGKYWNEQITKGKGSYYNCNRNSYPEHGIGMLDHTDIDKRKNLDNALAYLSKDEQHIDEISDKKQRSFVRGTMPKSKGNIGRPRKEKEELIENETKN
jgi:hypothetical protein